jgi:hypothetical protein
MKTTVKITGILMMFILAGTLSLNAQRGSRSPGMQGQNRMGMERPQRPMMLEPSDSLKKRGMRNDMAENMNRLNSRQMMKSRQMMPQSRGMRQMAPGDRMGRGFGRPGMAPGDRMGRGVGRRGMAPGDMMGRGSGRPGDRMDWGGRRQGMRNVPFRMMTDSIPGLTEEQKKEIAKLKQEHQAEMQKFNEEMQKFRDEMQKMRQEMQAKMKEFRESHKEEMMKILNEEQKERLRD